MQIVESKHTSSGCFFAGATTLSVGALLLILRGLGKVSPRWKKPAYLLLGVSPVAGLAGVVSRTLINAKEEARKEEEEFLAAEQERQAKAEFKQQFAKFFEDFSTYPLGISLLVAMAEDRQGTLESIDSFTKTLNDVIENHSQGYTRYGKKYVPKGTFLFLELPGGFGSHSFEIRSDDHGKTFYLQGQLAEQSREAVGVKKPEPLQADLLIAPQHAGQPRCVGQGSGGVFEKGFERGSARDIESLKSGNSHDLNAGQPHQLLAHPLRGNLTQPMEAPIA